MDEDKRVPPQGQTPEKSDKPAPSPAPSREKLAMIERAALAMADRKRPKNTTEQSAAQTLPLGPEPPEPFIIDSADMTAPRVSLKPPPAPPSTARAPAPPLAVADKAAATKLIAEFDQLLGAASARTTPATPSMAEPISAITFEAANESKTASPSSSRSSPANVTAALRPLFDDQLRLSPSRLQSAAITVAICVFVAGAALLTARTWTVAHDWSCRTGMMTNFCPQPLAMPKPALPELPT